MITPRRSRASTEKFLPRGGDVCVMRHLSSSSHLSNYLRYMVKPPLPVEQSQFSNIIQKLIEDSEGHHHHQKLEIDLLHHIIFIV